MDKIDELLTRGVDKIYPSKEILEKILRSGKKLKLYQGFDPSGIQLHIGHMVGLRKLRQWQDAGHHVIFLIGDGTGQAGDPSGKTRAREKFLTREELRKNADDYVMQAGKIVRFEGKNAVEILYNGNWLNKLTLTDVLNIAGYFSLQQLEERELFDERKKQGQSINFREFLYPLLQAYDSVAMEVDLELGGTDQTFNMLAGRHLVKTMQDKEKFVMTTPLLTDSKGIKIGKTEGNVIALTDEPATLYGKIMALPDDIVIKGLEYLTDIPIEEIGHIEKALARGENPLNHKKRLAFEIVKQLNDDASARNAREYFEKTVQKQELPKVLPIYQYIGHNDINIIDLLVQIGLTPSRSEARRLVEQGGITIDNNPIINYQLSITPKNGMIIRAGKRRFLKLEISN